MKNVTRPLTPQEIDDLLNGVETMTYIQDFKDMKKKQQEKNWKTKRGSRLHRSIRND